MQESCKKRDISRACAKQVLRARFLHNLHDFASSFLLGRGRGGERMSTLRLEPPMHMLQAWASCTMQLSDKQGFI